MSWTLILVMRLWSHMVDASHVSKLLINIWCLRRLCNFGKFSKIFPNPSAGIDVDAHIHLARSSCRRRPELQFAYRLGGENACTLDDDQFGFAQCEGSM